MKPLLEKLLGQLHLLIIAYAAYSFYMTYEDHKVQLAGIEEQIPAVEADIQKAKKKLKEIDEFKKSADDVKLRINDVFKNLETAQKQLPAEVDDIQTLDFFVREARGLNIPNLEPNPMKEQSMGFYISKPYSIKARGTFLQTVVFLERINAADRIYNVQSLSIKSDGVPQKGRFHVVDMEATIDTFKYNTSHKESSGIDEIEKQGRAGGDTEKPARRKRAPKEGGDA